MDSRFHAHVDQAILCYTAPVVDLEQDAPGELVRGEDPGTRELLERETPEEITAEDVRRQQEADLRQADENGEGAPFIETGERTPVEEARRQPTPGTDPGQQEAAQLEAERQRAEESQAQHRETKAIPYTASDAESIRHEGKSFRNVIAGIDTSVKEFFQKWKNGRKTHQGDKLEKLYLGKITDSARAKISDILGYNVTSTDYILTSDGVKHIYDEHGDAKKELEKGNLPLSDDVIEMLPGILEKPDSIERGHKEKRGDRTGIIFKKKLKNGTVVYVQFDNTGRGTIEGRTLYVKKDVTTSAVNAEKTANTFTSKTTEPVTSEISIPDSAGNSNKNFSTENSRAELEQEYKRRYDAFYAASDANDTEYDYKGELDWMKEAEKQIGKERAAQIANGEITPGQVDGPVTLDQAEQELLDVGEAKVETENGKYRLLVRRQSNGDYMAKVFKDGGEQIARRFSTPAEAAQFASDYLKGQEQGYQDAAEEAERSPEQEPEVPTELPDGREEEREYIRKKKNETAKLSNPALRDRILRTQSQIDSLKRMDRNPGTRLTEQQRAHIEDLQETLDILVEESNARKQRAKDRRGKAKEADKE